MIAPQADETRLVLEGIAEKQGSPVIQVGKDYLYASVFSLPYQSDGVDLA